MKLSRRGKILLAVLLLCFAAGTALLIHANVQVRRCGSAVYTDTEKLPFSHYGLVPGTAKIIKGNQRNCYFFFRMEAAAELYRKGKVKKLILSGDNGRKSYNEPEDMRQELLKAGVKNEDMLLDYAGFRTLDSVLRARNYFGATDFTVISQHFHCRRAIYIARAHGLNAIGFAAKEVPGNYRIKRFFREPLACLAAWADVKVLNRKPRFEY